MRLCICCMVLGEINACGKNFLTVKISESGIVNGEKALQCLDESDIHHSPLTYVFLIQKSSKSLTNYIFNP